MVNKKKSIAHQKEIFDFFRYGPALIVSDLPVISRKLSRYLTFLDYEIQ